MAEQSARVASEPRDDPRSNLLQTVVRTAKAFFAKAARWLAWVREFFHTAPVAGASIVPSLLAGLLIAFPDQMRESIRILAESWLRMVVFVIATLIASLTAWYWARVMIYR